MLGNELSELRGFNVNDDITDSKTLSQSVIFESNSKIVAESEPISDKEDSLSQVELKRYADDEKILKFIEELAFEFPEVTMGYSSKMLLDRLLFITDWRMSFKYKGTNYTMGKDSYRVARGSDGSVIHEKLGEVAQCGELSFFIKVIADTIELIDKHKDNPWLHDSSLKQLWLLASTEDVVDPVSYLKKRRFEIISSTELLSEFTLDNIDVRSKTESLLVQIVQTEKAYVEGPIKLKCEFLNEGIIDSSSEIHSVIMGKSESNLVTIYALQLEDIEGVSKQTLLNLEKENRTIEIGKITQDVQKYFGETYQDIGNLSSWDTEQEEERDKALLSWQKFEGWYKKDLSKGNSFLVSHITPAINLLKIENLQKKFAERDKNLKRFNHGVSHGGAKMVSFITTLMYLKKNGIERINIPLELPMAQHVYDTKKDDSEAKIETLSYIRAGLIKVIQDFSRIYDVEIKSVNDHYEINLNTWRPDEILTKDSKTIKGLVHSFNL